MIHDKRFDFIINEDIIINNWNKLIQLIDSNIISERKDIVLDYYKKYENRLSVAPASGRLSYHSCFVGGYIDHVLNVIQIGMKIDKLWNLFGANKLYTDEELFFSILNHDLGKLGDKDHDYYILNDSDWHRKNMGLIYKPNPELQYMSVPDRSIFLLQSHGIHISENEYLAIKLHDGLYDDSNKSYYTSFDDGKKLKCNLPYIVHQADIMAYRIEWEIYQSYSKH